MVGSLPGSSHVAGIEVVVDHGGDRRSGYLTGRPTVGDALAAMGMTLVAAHTLSARTHQPIAGHDIAATVTLDGRRATGATLIVGPRPHIEVLDAHDATEAVVSRPLAENPAPALPRLIHRLWHPGSPGIVEQRRVGVLSGEVVGGRSMALASAPAPVQSKRVALTFDDGPWPDTAAFVAVLQQAEITATFCMIGTQVNAHPEWARAVLAAGMTVCNHTLDHNEHLDQADAATTKAEVDGGAAALSNALGKMPDLYRSPGGILSPLVEDDAAALGEQVIGWNVDPSDYKKPDAAKIVATVMAQVTPGAIILLHDGGGDRSQTLAALPQIINDLKDQGYSFTTPDTIPPIPANPPPANPSHAA